MAVVGERPNPSGASLSRSKNRAAGTSLQAEKTRPVGARPRVSAFRLCLMEMRIAGVGWSLSCGLSLLLLAPGCVEPPGAARIVGPDGSPMLHVHCQGEQAACFRIAGDRCPFGYDLSPVFDPRDGNFLVRCREPQAAPARLASAPPPPPPPPPPPLNDSWPPTEVGKPSEPWPAHASSEAPITYTQNGRVDFGY